MKWENLIIAMNANHQTKTDILLFYLEKTQSWLKTKIITLYWMLEENGSRPKGTQITIHTAIVLLIVLDRFRSFWIVLDRFEPFWIVS